MQVAYLELNDAARGACQPAWLVLAPGAMTLTSRGWVGGVQVWAKESPWLTWGIECGAKV